MSLDTQFGLFCFLLFAFGMAFGCILNQQGRKAGVKEGYVQKQKGVDEEDETLLLNLATHKSSKRRSDVNAYISKSNKVHSKRDCSEMGEQRIEKKCAPSFCKKEMCSAHTHHISAHAFCSFNS